MLEKGVDEHMASIDAKQEQATALEQAIFEKTAKVGVVGLGYVGLPLIRAFVDAGYRTLGFDVDRTKIERLKGGESYIGHIAGEWIARCVTDQRFEPTADMARLAEADCIIICVPTPLSESRDPDLTYIEATARQIAAHLRPEQLVVLESTTYPGTTRDVVLPILETSGLVAGKDFYLAYSPEREDPGNPRFAASSIPKVVGGIDATSRRAAALLYGQSIVKVIPVSTCEVAEACKILENTYRSVNIALVNELKVLFDRMGIDVWEVIDAAKTKPFGFQPFYPGPGLGGHCIPIDPFYLAWLARKYGMSSRFIELAGEVNTAMPDYVVAKVIAALNDDGRALRGSKVAILGVAYKKDVDDPRESPAFVVMERLVAGGAVLSYNDPYVPNLPRMRHHAPMEMESQPLTQQYLAQQDCVVLVTDHSVYDMQWIADHSPVLVDTRGATRDLTNSRGRIVRA